MMTVNEEAIFNQARQIQSESERAGYLRGACDGDAELHDRVQSLLRVHFEAEGFMATEVSPASESGLTETPGSTIGRYKILQEIGQGGMGVVYMAEQTEPVTRRVALKIIKLGMDTKSVVARFEAERQALAMMDHPNIARVLDGGATESGRPYFVMELVKGAPITEFCDKNKLDAPARLQLFIQVCRAVQSAHQKGIIHRDLKPSNILVTLHHGEPLPKIIDFGIAKATNQKLTEKTLFTNFAQMIGTPAYMSPEQAEMSSMDVDTRSDVYSLGVLLYELLTGTTPFPEKDLLSKGYGEMQRIIAEKLPERPSLRLSTLEGKQQSLIAQNRNAPIPTLSKRIQGDLDWIVLKALEKDRNRRYETANGMAEDVHRHLNGDPVLAAKPTLGYQLSKLYHRHKPAVAAAAGITLALVVGTGFATAEAIRANASNAVAQEARKRANIAVLNEKDLREKAQELAENLRLDAYVGDMKSADVLIKANDYETARKILLKHRPSEETNGDDLRGFEWRYLWEASRDRSLCQTTLPSATGLTLSHDNKTLVVKSYDRGLEILNPATLQSSGKITLENQHIFPVTFAPDDSKLYVLVMQKAALEPYVSTTKYSRHPEKSPTPSVLKLNIYDTENWTLAAQFENLETSLFFDDKNTPIVYSLQPHSGEPEFQRIVQSENGTYKLEPATGMYPNAALQFASPESALEHNLASAPPGWAITHEHSASESWSAEDLWTVWEVPATGLMRKAGAFPSHRRGKPIVSPDGNYFAYTTSGVDVRQSKASVARLFDLQTGTEINLDPSLGETAEAIAFTENPSKLVVGNRENNLEVWDVTTGDLIGSIGGHPAPIRQITIADDKVICLYEGSGEIRTWDLGLIDEPRVPFDSISTFATGFKTEELGPDPTPEFADRLNPRFLDSLRSGAIDGKLPRNLYSSTERSTGSPRIRPEISPNGRYLRIKGKFYDLTQESKLVADWSLPPVIKVREHYESKYIGIPMFINDSQLVVETLNEFQLWDLEHGSQTKLSIGAIIERGYHTHEPIVTRFEDVLAFGYLKDPNSYASDVALWSVSKDQEIGIYPYGGALKRIEFSENGSLMALVGSEPGVVIYDLSSGTERLRLSDGNALSLSPDGRTLLTDNHIHGTTLWNLQTGREMVHLDRFQREGARRGLQFSRDGKSLYGSGDHGEWWSVRFLTPRSLEEIDTEINATRNAKSDRARVSY